MTIDSTKLIIKIPILLKIEKKVCVHYNVEKLCDISVTSDNKLTHFDELKLIVNNTLVKNKGKISFIIFRKIVFSIFSKSIFSIFSKSVFSKSISSNFTQLLKLINAMGNNSQILFIKKLIGKNYLHNLSKIDS